MINEVLNKEIKEINLKIDKEVNEKIKEYENCFNYDNEKFFCELAFCILTPQSKALNAWDIIQKLDANRLLYNGDFSQIVDYLNTIRFKNTKAKRLIKLREQMTLNGKLDAKKIIFFTDDIYEVRKWLVDNIDGMGLKEASHFLRNVGFGKKLAILDRHILRVLTQLNVIDEIPKTLTYKKYLEIEKKMIEYSKYSKISMDRLDLVLWHRQVGYIFK